MSRMYNYIRSLQLEGTYSVAPSPGVWTTTGLRVMKGWGTPDEVDWPYGVDLAHWPPVEPQGVDEKAKKGRILAYQRARSVADCQALLARGRPVIVALRIDDSWYTAPHGAISAPDPRQPATASHSILLVGYDDAARQLTFRNSWGVTWGDGGYGYLPYDYLVSRLLEMWTVAEPLWMGAFENTGGITERRWGISDPLAGILHGVEVGDGAADEVIAWAFAVERNAYLDLEELFVRPAWRGQGYGRILASNVLSLSVKFGRPLRAWVPHIDATDMNRPALLGTMRRLGLEIQRCSQPWASRVGK